MRLKDIIRAEKVVTDWGNWGSDRMPRTAFPLSKARSRFFRLSAFRWRVIVFSAVDQSFRLLIAYRTDKEQYRAVLAMEQERDMTVLASYEFHGTHPGWHVVATCEEVTDAPKGVMRRAAISEPEDLPPARGISCQ